MNFLFYQVNCTYYSALGSNDDAYIAARVIQFFSPGVPQVYYIGILAGENDIELLEKTKLGRNINLHNYTIEVRLSLILMSKPGRQKSPIPILLPPGQ